MPEYVIVRIDEELIPEFQIKYNSKSNTAKSSIITSWTDIDLKKHETLILMVSAALVLTTKVKIPSKNEEIIRQSIPYAIEEEIIGEIDECHFSYLHLKDQCFLVSVIRKEIIESIHLHLFQENLICGQLYSEIFSCPNHSDSISICILHDYAIIRDDYNGTTINKNVIAPYLKLSKKDKQIVYSRKSLDLGEKTNFTSMELDTTLLQSQLITSDHSVNLFQGIYAQNLDKKHKINPVKKSLVLVSILILSWLFVNIYHAWKLSTDINEIKKQQQELLSNIVPNASQTEKNDPYSALLSFIKSTQTHKSRRPTQGLIDALTYLGQTLVRHPSIQVESMRLRNEKVEIKLQAQNVSLLNQFQKSLENNVFTMRVKTGTRNTNNKGISSVITMEKL